MKRKLLSAALILCITLMILPVSAAAEKAVGVEIDGTQVEFTESSGSPFVDSNSRTLVPLRVTMEACGCEVTWDNENYRAVVYKNGVTVVVPIGENRIIVNGVPEEIDTAAVAKNNRTYLPIRAVLEAFGSDVGWDGENWTVTVSLHERDYGECDDHTAAIVAAIGRNTGISQEDREVLTDYAQRLFANLTLTDDQAASVANKFSTLRISHGSLEQGLDGWADTAANTIAVDDGKFTAALNQVYYYNTFYHEVNHIIAGNLKSCEFISEALVETLAEEFSGAADYASDYRPWVIAVRMMAEVIGTEVLEKAILTGNPQVVFTALQQYDGKDSASAYLLPLMDQLKSYYMAMDGENLRVAATEFCGYIYAAYENRYHVSAEEDPVMEAYASYLKGMWSGGTPLQMSKLPVYFRKDAAPDYVVVTDREKTYCDDGTFIVYLYERPCAG
ncbi:copper amine oxidase N-terminal domain-containing protein [Papillibacter cinnamivorans]|uniref:Copper amine oxidase N-terminal domain-containing protein n=1 Tax=Papillibacter cinnamivorans DSM 12816 TaxID=1122930 RepID=A0A1W2CPE5_9FIRM|nr:copper amine oxidase N-terminal domain-containing protein [Papillibacter cinnamivorans]SMC86752.1 Copper amine oxidase N-terminal domain-containing protein [Papillibacter cinnamivorans DSM 12816]